MSPARNAGHQARPPDFSPREFRASLGMFATGVTIVTARTASGELAGLTASSFNSVSLDPPLVLWSLAQAAGSMAVFANGQHYAINVLAADQQALAERFAARDVDRWQGVDFVEGVSGAPLLTGCVATFECFNRSQYTEGDHVIFVGEVERCSRRAAASPLLYHGGRFYTEHPLQGSQAAPSAPQAPDDRFVGSYLGYLLGQANHAVYRDFENAIAAQGLTHIAWRVLAVLHDAALSPAARGAQRRTLVVTTDTGRRIATALIAQARQQETTLLARWSASEAEAFKRHLQKLVNEPPHAAAARVVAPARGRDPVPPASGG